MTSREAVISSVGLPDSLNEVPLEPKPETLGVGATVTIRFKEEETTDTFQFSVPPEEATREEKSRYISPDSPLGKAIAGRLVGETVLVRQPKMDDIHIKIVSFSNS